MIKENSKVLIKELQKKLVAQYGEKVKYLLRGFLAHPTLEIMEKIVYQYR